MTLLEKTEGVLRITAAVAVGVALLIVVVIQETLGAVRYGLERVSAKILKMEGGA